MQSYVRHLLLERLSKATVDSVARLAVKLPWHEEEEFVAKCLTQLVTAQSKFSEVSS